MSCKWKDVVELKSDSKNALENHVNENVSKYWKHQQEYVKNQI